MSSQQRTTEGNTSGNLAFSLDEYAARIAALRGHMAAAGIDVLLIDQFEHLSYFTGHLPTAAMYQVCLLPLERDPVMIVRDLDAPVLAEMSWVREAVLFSDSDDPIEQIALAMRRRGYERARLGVEEDSHFFTVSRMKALQAALPEVELVDFSRVMWEMRLVKSPAEIVYLERASQICDAGAAAGFEAAAEGVGEREVAAAVTGAALRAGADNTRLLLMASGPRSAALHGSLGMRTLAAGDILHLEMVPHFKGYTARLMRPKYIGVPEDVLLRTAETLISIQDRQYAAMVPGAIAADVDAIVREGVLEAGLREAYTNITAYTLGNVAIPRTSDFTRVFLPQANWELEANMVFHVYCWAQGVAFSDTVVVTPAGGQCLTRIDRRLFHLN